MDGHDPELIRDSRPSYHATPYNIDDLRVPGVIGKAVTFDGVNDYSNCLWIPIHPRVPNN